MRRPGGLLLLLLLVAVGVTGCTSVTPVPDQSGATMTTPSPDESLLPSPTATVSTVGGLAAGFPTDLIAVPEGSEILMSAAELDEATGLTEISLNLRTVLTTDELLAQLRPALVNAAFTETSGDAAVNGLAAMSTFVRADDSSQVLTLGVLDRDGVRTLTLGGSVRL